MVIPSSTCLECLMDTETAAHCAASLHEIRYVGLQLYLCGGVSGCLWGRGPLDPLCGSSSLLVPLLPISGVAAQHVTAVLCSQFARDKVGVKVREGWVLRGGGGQRASTDPKGGVRMLEMSWGEWSPGDCGTLCSHLVRDKVGVWVRGGWVLGGGCLLS